MAGAAKLKAVLEARPVKGAPRWKTGLLALAAAVALGHFIAIEYLHSAMTNPSALKIMAAPMFTRMLTPEVPPVVVAQAAPPLVPVAPPRPSARTIPRAVAPKPAASEPAPTEVSPPPETKTAAPVPEVAPQIAAPEQAAASEPAPSLSTANSTPPIVGMDAVAATPSLQDWPNDTRLTYRLNGFFRGPLHGNAKVQWQRDGALYQVRVEIDPNLLPGWVMTSQGEVRAEGLAPRLYEEVQLNRTRTVKLGDSSVTLNDGRNVPRPAYVQDTASQFIELSHRFSTGQVPLASPGQISVWLARPGAVDLWTYDITGPEFLETKLGRLEAWHLKPRPIPNPRGNITAEIWFAPALRHLPVRIRVNQGEETFVDLRVEQIEQR